MTAVTETDDIQALVRTGFGSLRGAAYLLLRVREPVAARKWLAAAAPASIADLAGGKVDSAVQIALTAAGLAALGLDAALLAQFSPEFQAGAADPSRARRLGDSGGSAPDRWAWGQGEREPHLLVMLFCAATGFTRRLTALRKALAAGFDEVALLDTGDMKGREPFGFLDGISQPALDWTGAAPLGPSLYSNRLAAGEVLLGYRNEYGLITDRPLLPDAAPGAQLLAAAPDAPGMRDLARNGSYLVFRRLAQDVRGFWAWIDANGGLPLAEAMVGRKLDGAPLDGLGQRAIDGETDSRNDFTYDRDANGHACPHGGHIRRANPRNSDHPDGPGGVLQGLASTLGFRGTARGDAVASTRFHRILRRGREYGQWLAPDAAAKPGPERDAGLNFICLQASISRQFEFVQGAWLNSAKFGGLADEQDPLCGSRDDHPPGCPAAAFSRPREGDAPRRYENLPRFVHVRGAAYFFLPSLRALRYLAATPPK